MSADLQALGHSIKAPVVKAVMRALGVKAPSARSATRDYEGNILDAEANGTRGGMTFMGQLRYAQDYGPPRSRTSRDDNELILSEIDFNRRGVALPYGLRLGDSQAEVVEKLGKKPREKSSTEYGTAWWFYVATSKLIAAFDRAGRLKFLRAFGLDLAEQRRAAASKKAFVLKVPSARKKRPTAAWTRRMRQGDTAFTTAAIAKADALLVAYLASITDLAKAQKQAGLLPATKRLVTALNTLNRQHRGGLIETMEREELCAFIDATLRATGIDPGGDVTEPWREW